MGGVAVGDAVDSPSIWVQDCFSKKSATAAIGSSERRRRAAMVTVVEDVDKEGLLEHLAVESEAKELRDEALLLRSEHPAHGKTGYFHQAALGVHLRARADGGATIGIDGRRVHLDKAALAEFLEESSTAVRVYVEVFALSLIHI